MPPSTPAARAISVGVVDDDPKDRAHLITLLKRYQSDHARTFRITQFEDAAALLMDYTPEYDILFLDIQMDGIDGMRAATAIRKVDTSVVIIFVTNTAQYAVSGYSVQAQSYLLKPATYFALSTELERGLAQLNRMERASILVGSRTALRRVDVADIVYIESRRHKVTVHLLDEQIEFNATLKEYEDILEQHDFYRSNSSFLINLRHLAAIEGEDSRMSTGERLRISRARKKGLLDALASHIGGNLP